MPTQNEVWQALLAAFPEPDDVDAYLPALYYSQMADALSGLARVYADAFRVVVVARGLSSSSSRALELRLHSCGTWV